MIIIYLYKYKITLYAIQIKSYTLLSVQLYLINNIFMK